LINGSLIYLFGINVALTVFFYKKKNQFSHRLVE